MVKKTGKMPYVVLDIRHTNNDAEFSGTRQAPERHGSCSRDCAEIGGFISSRQWVLTALE
jgi:hypothetical protein